MIVLTILTYIIVRTFYFNYKRIVGSMLLSVGGEKIKLNSNSKILNITHNDLDGVGCAILLSYVFKNINVISCSYYNIDATLNSINIEDYDFIFVTDIFPNSKDVLYRFKNLMVIDHHQTATHSPKDNWFVNTKYSATYLVKHFIDKQFGTDILKHHEDIVSIIHRYDVEMWENRPSMRVELWNRTYKIPMLFNVLFRLYNFDKFLSRFVNGSVSLTTIEKQYLRDEYNSFNELYDNIDIYEFDKINGCFFVSDIWVNEIADKLLYEGGYDIVMFNTLKNYKISVRSKSNDLNIGIFLKERSIGGGHPKSGGVDINTEEDMNRILSYLDDEIYEHIPSVRRVG